MWITSKFTKSLKSRKYRGYRMYGKLIQNKKKFSVDNFDGSPQHWVADS